jgi:hypothetical protein
MKILKYLVIKLFLKGVFMKKVIAVACLLFVSNSVIARRLPAAAKGERTAKISFTCSTPKNFNGPLSVVEGTLTLEAAPNGSAAARGKLAVKLGTKINGSFNFMGQYDNGNEVKPSFQEYFHGGTDIDGEILALYADFTNPKNSYLEYLEKNQPLHCVKQ